MMRRPSDICDPLEGWKEKVDYALEVALSAKSKAEAFEPYARLFIEQLEWFIDSLNDLKEQVDLNIIDIDSLEERIIEIDETLVIIGTTLSGLRDDVDANTNAIETIEGDISDIRTALDSKVTANTDITGATKCKITYDSKGLVTSGVDLTATDIPNLATSKITSGTFADARIPALAISKITGLQTALDSKLNVSLKGSADGLAELDANGKVPSTQLPSYVDDVLEYANLATFPATGESGKIYIALNDNKTYRWSGSTYVEISPSLALGETSATAYRGDRGKTAYEHVSKTDNPHGVTKAQVGLTNVANVLQYSASNAPPYPVTSVAGKAGAVTLAKGDVGLGNVDNTADSAKPVSTAQQSALDAKVHKRTSGNEVYSHVGVNQSGITYTPSATANAIPQRGALGQITLPTTQTTGTTDAVHKGYVDAELDNTVKLTGNQTIGGDKTFTGAIRNYMSGEVVSYAKVTDRGVYDIPFSGWDRRDVLDKDNKLVARNAVHSTMMYVRNQVGAVSSDEDGVGTEYALYVYAHRDGYGYVTVPTRPSPGDDDVVTVGMLKAKGIWQ